MSCKKPCKACPWRTDSTKGYLGGNSVETYVAGLNGDARYACHSRHPEAVELKKVPIEKVCVGYVIARVNDLKRAKNPELRALESAYMDSPYRPEVFKFPVKVNFANHHDTEGEQNVC